jgi:hypothetical protein
MKCVNLSSGLVVSADVKTAFDAKSRMEGLLPRTGLNPGESLLIKPCSQIHTFFMKFAIDAVFIDKKGRVLKVVHEIKPWRISAWVIGADGVLELAAGACRGKVKKGDTLEISG